MPPEVKSSLVERVLQFFGLTRVPPPAPPAPVPVRQLPTRTAQRSWAGAQISRLTADWVTQPLSIDAEVRQQGRVMRARARQLRKDNPLAARFVQLQSENIIGPHGIALQCRIENTRNGINETASDAIEWAWWDWCKRENCTVDGKLCWTEVLTQYVEGWKQDGESLLILHPGFPNKYGFAVQLMDPDQLDDDYNVPAGDDRNEVRMGVEVNGWGRPVAYHVLTRHPGDWFGDTRRIREPIPAERVRHRFTPLGAGQTRGITPMAPVMLQLQTLGGSQEAILMLQRASACKMGFLEVDPELATPLTPTEDADGSAAVAEQPPVVTWDAEPLRIEQLPKGFTFKHWDPGAPTAEYDVFVRDIKREIAAGLGVSYASLTGDQSQANFGSQRVAMTSERDGYKRDQCIIVEDCGHVFMQWATSAMMRGAIQVPGYNIEALMRAAEWQPRGFDWIDPEKDVKAELAEVGAGLNSLTRIAASKGRDRATILKERAKEIQQETALAVPISLNANSPTPPPEPKDMQPTKGADRAMHHEFSIGDRVRVKAGAEHDEMTKEAVGTVEEMGGEALGILFDGMEEVHKWYVPSELEKADDAETEPSPSHNGNGKATHAAVRSRVATRTREDRIAAALEAIAAAPQQQPVINVTTPDVRVDAPITVHVPKPASRTVELKRDERGRLIGSTTTEQ